MKRLFVLLSILTIYGLSQEVQASHVAGAEIYYRYIGDSTGIARQYEITLLVYRDSDGIGYSAASESVCVKSSCFTTYSVSLPRVPVPASQQYDPPTDIGIVVPGFLECATPDGGNRVVTLHTFRSTTILPPCSGEVKFFWRLNARNDVDNMVNADLTTFYIESKLNLSLGHNSSPKFVTPAAKAFCVGYPFVWVQAAVENDGDSLRYSFVNPQQYSATTGCNGTESNLTWVAGYSTNQPLTPAPGTSIVVDEANGAFYFTPGAVEAVALRVDVQEYRFDTITNLWTLVGTTARDMQVLIEGTCLASVQDGPKIDVSGPGYYTDTVGGEVLGTLAGVRISNDSIADSGSPTGYSYILPVVDYNCLDSSVTIKFSPPIQCGSIDGTEFRVVGPDTLLRPVIDVVPNCGVDLEADEMVLKLLKPLTVNGDYFVYVKPGMVDGNTFTNNCGFQLAEFYTFKLRVDGCFLPSYQLKNVTIDNDYNPRIEFELDQNSFPDYLLDHLEIYRSDDQGASFNFISTYNGAQALTTPTWSDLSLNGFDVDNNTFDYRIRMVVNGETYQLSNSIRSIRLDTGAVGGNPAPNADEYALWWNSYNGWANPEYTVMLGDLKTNTWNAHTQAGNPTSDTTYYFKLPSDSGDYAIRIDASDPAGSGYVASSNWILFSITVPPIPIPEDVEVPNVFTPNGDGTNDLFRIRNQEQYSTTSVTVFNRWGQKVYENANYQSDWNGTDFKTGKPLGDGVYFYVINMKDDASGKELSFEGNVTIFTSSN